MAKLSITIITVARFRKMVNKASFNNNHSKNLLENKTAPSSFQYTHLGSPQVADQILRRHQEAEG